MIIRCLILKFDDVSKILYCFHRETLKLLRVRIPEEAEATPGQFLLFETDEVKGSDLLLTIAQCLSGKAAADGPKEGERVRRRWHRGGGGILKIKSGKIEEPLKEDCIVKGDGKFKIASWIVFSDNPNHRTFDRSVAFSDWYGFVKCEGFEEHLKKHKGHRSFIGLNDLDYKKNKTQLFKLLTIRERFLETHLLNDLLEKATLFEESHLKKDLSEPSVNPYDSDTFEDSVVVVHEISEDLRIGWLWETKKAALIRLSKVGQVITGKKYNCIAKKIPESYEVEHEVRIIKFRLRQGDILKHFLKSQNEILAKASLDLCSPCTKFRNFQFYTGIPILNAVNFGMVTVDDEIYHPRTGRTQKWQVAFRDFIGEENSLRTLALCRLVRQKVPRGFGNSESTEEDKFDCVRRYEWQMIRILGENENLEIETEFGNSQHLRDEDDIARQKKTNGRSHN